MNPSTGRRRVCREDYFPRHKNVQCHQSNNHRSELLWLQDTMFPTGTYYTTRYTEFFHQFLTMFYFFLRKPHHVLPADNLWWNTFFVGISCCRPRHTLQQNPWNQLFENRRQFQLQQCCPLRRHSDAGRFLGWERVLPGVFLPERQGHCARV
jgi:hypothetical protein